MRSQRLHIPPISRSYSAPYPTPYPAHIPPISRSYPAHIPLKSRSYPAHIPWARGRCKRQSTPFDACEMSRLRALHGGPPALAHFAMWRRAARVRGLRPCSVTEVGRWTTTWSHWRSSRP